MIPALSFFRILVSVVYRSLTFPLHRFRLQNDHELNRVPLTQYSIIFNLSC